MSKNNLTTKIKLFVGTPMYGSMCKSKKQISLTATLKQLESDDDVNIVCNYQPYYRRYIRRPSNRKRWCYLQ